VGLRLCQRNQIVGAVVFLGWRKWQACIEMSNCMRRVLGAKLKYYDVLTSES
jgi:hypothetical protein